MKEKKTPLYYGDYLQLDRILNSQAPESLKQTGRLAHDEMLFIVVHQAYELWFKQILFELDSVLEIFGREVVDEKDMGTAVARLRRVIEIQKLLIEQVGILETMTPLDFLDFRHLLAPASGFQSYQFRLLENKLGLQPSQRKLFDKTHYHEHLSEAHQELVRRSEEAPSLFDLVERWLERTPFLDFGGFNFWENYRAAVQRMLERDKDFVRKNPSMSEEEKAAQLEEFAKTEKSFAAIFDEAEHERLRRKGFRRLSHRAMQAALLIHLYRDEPILHLPFAFLTALVDIDELLTAWRHRHALMVQRMIGSKVGTGGSSGHHYLRVVAESHKVFTDLTNLSTFLIPRSELPELPEELRRNLGFYYSKQET